MTSLYKTLRIVGIKNETADCKTFILTPVDGEPVPYTAGQFLTFVFQKTFTEDRRSYSISSTPALNEQLSVTVKRIENGEYSRKLLDETAIGDHLVTTGATGFFVLPNELGKYKQLFFIAAGSGITPVLPLIKTVLTLHPEIQIVLIYSNRSRETTIFYDQLKDLSNKYGTRLQIEFLFSSSLYLERARLSKWLLERLLKQFIREPLSNILFYCCGPFDFMRMAAIELLEDGVPLRNIRRENFSTLKQDIKIKPPDTDRHAITIHIKDNTYFLEAQYPQTILQAAKKEGIALPYSCEAGKCGSCAATCVKGKVWMSYNEVLLDEEMAKGRVLTCVGFPIEGDVILDYNK